MATAREQLEPEEALVLDRAVAERLAEIEAAHAEGRLQELVRAVPSVREQLAPFFPDS
jgi:hypothetical protein